MNFFKKIFLTIVTLSIIASLSIAFIGCPTKPAEPTEEAEATTEPEATTTEEPTPAEAITLDESEIGKHNSESDCWAIVDGKVYDFTTFLKMHPGAAESMIPFCGADMSDCFATHPEGVSKLLEGYYLGDLGAEVSGQDLKANVDKFLAFIKGPVEAKLPGGEIIKLEYEDGKYEAHVDQKGTEYVIYWDEDGKITTLKRVEAVEELPDSVTGAIENKYSGAKLEKARYIMEADKNKDTYQVYIEHEGKKYKVYVDDAGTILGAEER